MLNLMQHSFNHGFISNRIIAAGKSFELRNICPRGKGRLTCTFKDDHLQLIRVICCPGAGADLFNLLIHRKGQRITPVRPVQGEDAYAVSGFINQLIIWCHIVSHYQVS